MEPETLEQAEQQLEAVEQLLQQTDGWDAVDPAETENFINQHGSDQTDQNNKELD